MRRYWLPSESFLPGGEVELTGDQLHHICRVCRQGLGDRFEVLQGTQAHLVEVIRVDKKRAMAQILESRALPQAPRPHIHLALSLPRFATFEKVLEKSVELGVTSVHPFSSDFSFMKPKPKDLEKKVQRWQKIIVGATQQCGRGEFMTLTPIQPMGVLLQEMAERSSARAFLAYEGEDTQPFAQAMADLTPTEVQEVWIFVGGEGGFSAKDLSLFRDSGILPLGLGEQVLRVETACVTLLSILKYHLGHFG